jgi:hypothetical protein
MVFQFTEHSNLPKGSACPVSPMFQLYGKAVAGQELTREEKDLVAERLYGAGAIGGSMYKLGGFAAPFSQVAKRILVNSEHYGWTAYYAFDKMSLRKALKGLCTIIEMHYI